MSRNRMRFRRGGTITIAIVGLAATLITLGVEMDAGRLFTARHQDQIIADAATMAAALKLPREDACRTAANLVTAQYSQAYNRTFVPVVDFQHDPAGLA